MATFTPWVEYSVARPSYICGCFLLLNITTSFWYVSLGNLQIPIENKINKYISTILRWLFVNLGTKLLNLAISKHSINELLNQQPLTQPIIKSTNQPFQWTNECISQLINQSTKLTNLAMSKIKRIWAIWWVETFSCRKTRGILGNKVTLFVAAWACWWTARQK